MTVEQHGQELDIVVPLPCCFYADSNDGARWQRLYLHFCTVGSGYTSSISFTVYGWHTLANLSAHGDSVVYILQSSTSNVMIMGWCNRKTAGLRAVRLLLAQTLAHDILKTNTSKKMHKKTPLISNATQHIKILLRICWGNEGACKEN